MNNSQQKSLLPKRASNRDALTYSFSIFKSRLAFLKEIRLKPILPKITIALTAVGFLLGYQPTMAFPPIKQGVVFAQEEGLQQSAQVQSSNFPIIQLPHPGYISTHYSRVHPGVDIAEGLNTPIKPIADGVVEAVNFGFFGYGNNVVVKHAGNLASMYAHMNKVFVKKGDEVSLGSVLGTIGLTGFTTGPHDHLEIYLDGRTIDPLTVLPPLPDKPAEEFLKPFTKN